MLQIIDTGISSAQANMRFDEKLLERLTPNSDPILHLYQWKHPSATYGYFVRPESHLDFEKAKMHHLDLAQRPTGGGIVFHIWDLAFSFLMPAKHPAFSFNTLENYAFINNIILEVIQNYFSLAPELVKEDEPSLTSNYRNFCMAMPTQYDVVYRGMKIAGAAQRRRCQGYLHQGTISLVKPKTEFLKEVLLSLDVLEAMTTYTFAPLTDHRKLDQVKADLQKLLADKLAAKLRF